MEQFIEINNCNNPGKVDLERIDYPMELLVNVKDIAAIGKIKNTDNSYEIHRDGKIFYGIQYILRGSGIYINDIETYVLSEVFYSREDMIDKWNKLKSIFVI